MNTVSRDPILNVVHHGIKRGIRVALENECYPAAVILILSGIDAMAFLGMPEGRDNVTRRDFVDWADRYVKFPCRQQLTGMDLYGARCGMLHQHGVESALSRAGKCRSVGYRNRLTPEVKYDPQVSKDLVMVSVPALAESFLAGVDTFLVDLFSDPVRAAAAERRFGKMVHTLQQPSGG